MPDGHARLPESATRSARYLEDYAEHFGLSDRIRLGAEVRRRAPRRRRRLGDRARRTASPSAPTCSSWPTATTRCRSWPDPPYPGEFDGDQLHALDYDDAERAPRPQRDGRRHGQQRDGHRHRHLARGRPHAPVGAPRQLGDPQAPARAARRPGHPAVGRRARAVADPPAAVASRCCGSPSGRPSATGCPGPSAACSRSHPTITDTVLSRISHGEITPKPGIERFDGRPRALHRRQRGAGRRDRVVHRLPGRDPVPRRVARRARPARAAALQARPPPRARRPLLRRADAVHRQRRSRSSSASRRCWPSTWPGAGRRRRGPRCAPSASAAAGGPCAAGATHGRPSMRVDFDLYMHELAEELDAGRQRAARSRRMSRRRARHRRQRRLRHGAARGAARPRLAGGRPRPAPRPRRPRGARLRRDRRRRRARGGRRGDRAPRRRARRCS